MQEQPIRVLMSKPGLDSHWRGILVVSLALRNAGMEVIYGGNQTAAEIAEAAVQEDVDVVGLSILSAGHLRLIAEAIEALRRKGKDDVLLLVGGTIPHDDISQLKELGVDEVFLPGTPLENIVDYVQHHMASRQAS